MSSDIAIRVEGLGKAYTVRHRRHDHVTLAQTALERLKHPFHRDEREEFWALRDVSFEVKQGEVLGIIGRNGAGKSTLLKLLTRITAPTTGRVDLWGRVGSLLEVGTGFHPELTGRENVYLNGSILGMTRKEIDRQFDEIVAFAGVEKFLDTPVKRYSSGMYVRLAFAVAAHLQTEILLVDEVLAVGDAEFQQKCLTHLRRMAACGRVIVLVSHDLTNIERLCSSVLWLETGALKIQGPAQVTLQQYRTSNHGDVADVANAKRVASDLGQEVRIIEVRRQNSPTPMLPGEALTWSMSIHRNGTAPPLRVGVAVHDRRGKVVATGFTEEVIAGGPSEGLQVTVECSLPSLAPGFYTASVSVGTGGFSGDFRDYDYITDVLSFSCSHPLITDEFLANGNEQWGQIVLAPAVTRVADYLALPER